MVIDDGFEDEAMQLLVPLPVSQLRIVREGSEKRDGMPDNTRPT